MQTHQHWRNPCSVHFIVLSQDWTLLFGDVIWSCVMASYPGPDFVWGQSNQKTLDITFFFLWPWSLKTLTVELVRDFINVNPYHQFWCLYVKRLGWWRSWTAKHIDRQKHYNTGPILLPWPLTSYYKTRSVCGRVCPASPPLFTGWHVPNLAGRSGSGTEKVSRGMFPWQPSTCHSNPKKLIFWADFGLTDPKLGIRGGNTSEYITLTVAMVMFNHSNKIIMYPGKSIITAACNHHWMIALVNVTLPMTSYKWRDIINNVIDNVTVTVTLTVTLTVMS